MLQQPATVPSSSGVKYSATTNRALFAIVSNRQAFDGGDGGGGDGGGGDGGDGDCEVVFNLSCTRTINL